MRGPRVYITQADPRKNFLPATEYGELVFILPAGDQVFMDSGPTIQTVRTAMRDFQDGDFILPVGDPVGIGIVCAEACRVNSGRYAQLKFDRQSSRARGVPVYFPVLCDHS